MASRPGTAPAAWDIEYRGAVQHFVCHGVVLIPHAQVQGQVGRHLKFILRKTRK
jgi:hypothetical protein